MPYLATKKELAEKAIKHYNKLSEECCDYNSVVIESIKLYGSDPISKAEEAIHETEEHLSHLYPSESDKYIKMRTEFMKRFTRKI